MTTSHTRKEKTREKIIRCFWTLYRQKGIDKITVSEITTLCNINRSTFYAYFKDVYDVLDQIEAYYLPSSLKFFKKCAEIQDKEQLYLAFLKMFDETYEELTFLLSDQGDPNFINKLKKSIRPVFRETVPIRYRENPYFDLTVEYILSSSISVITYWANHPCNITSKELFDHLHTLYVYGIPYSFGISETKEDDNLSE